MPEVVTSVGLVDSSSTSGEPFRSLYLALRLRHPGKDGVVCVVASAEPKAGKSTIAANLALIAAGRGARVLLLDADVRRPVQHVTFEVARAPGLVDFLAGDADLESLVRHTACGVDVIPAGRGLNFLSDITSWPRLSQPLQRLAKVYDLIVIDTSPILAGAEAEAIAAYSESEVALVVSTDSRRRDVVRALRKLELTGAHIAGIVQNRLGTLDTYGY